MKKLQKRNSLLKAMLVQRRRLSEVAHPCSVSRVLILIKNVNLKVYNFSYRTWQFVAKADQGYADQDIFVSRHFAKPGVSGISFLCY